MVKERVRMIGEEERERVKEYEGERERIIEKEKEWE